MTIPGTTLLMDEPPPAPVLADQTGGPRAAQASATFTDCQVAPAADARPDTRPLAAQVQAGFPAGLRVQVPLTNGPCRYTVAEVFGGCEWTVLVAMVGVRRIFEMPLHDPHNAFLVGPGLHAVYFHATQGSQTQGGGGLVDATVGRAFDRQARGSWEFGFNAGLGVMAYRQAVFPLPTVGIYTGLRF